MRYRIVQKSGYNGCEPVTIHWVQVRKVSFWGERWENVKGFEDPEKADQLLEILSNR